MSISKFKIDKFVFKFFISSFNYPIYLNSKGYIILPLANKRIKLEVYDYITSEDIGKLINKK